MKFQLPSGLTRAVSSTVLKSKANSPQILFVAGVAGIVTSGVLACKSTLKIHEVQDEHRKTALDIKTIQHENYTEQDRKHDLTLLYVQTAVKYTKLYGPSILLASVSIAMLTKSHNILTKRNAALSAAYAAVEKGFKDYRGRVREELGDEKDREFLYGKETGTIMVEDKNGVKKHKKTSAAGTSAYSQIFDEYNKNWNPYPEYNILFLRGQQNFLNDKLRADGHVFLNDVYRALGFEDTTAGAVVGWVYDNPEGGDNVIDFGIWDSPSMDRMHDFLVGREGGIMLDFNVDGEIFRLLDLKKKAARR
jgi:hypothetical protein